MEITDERIDGGKAFDWGKTSEDYARYRDIYPPIFYRKIIDRLPQNRFVFRKSLLMLLQRVSASGILTIKKSFPIFISF